MPSHPPPSAAIAETIPIIPILITNRVGGVKICTKLMISVLELQTSIYISQFQIANNKKMFPYTKMHGPPDYATGIQENIMSLATEGFKTAGHTLYQ